MNPAHAIRRVALIGSSFAAGPDIDPIIEATAGRSGNNYGEIVARHLGATIADLAVSGATTANMLSTVQRFGRRRFPPQVPQLPDDVELVMITGGGNDLGYLQSIMPAAMAGRFDGSVITRPLALATRLIFGTPEGKDAEVAASGLTQVVRAVRDRAPGARVVLVGYPVLFGADSLTDPQERIRPADLAAIKEIGRRLDQAYELAAERTGAELIKTWEFSHGHAAGSAEPWVNGIRGVPGDGAALHPNAAGHRALADAVLALLRTDGPRRTAADRR
ncbi:hydrolase [Microlunatus endophyticus]|uniref:Hydrolase n=1 Tax=Microlunatus endophyticus TaxID=1716077 RepID=A0A917SE13_9ACTN|nr:SGNH/GDSL hydrolase family protein [Microlunatus endophyticus]GGL71615.1 hydrolase [Microlunatus endophyticus]